MLPIRKTPRWIGLVAPSGDYNRGASTLWPAALVYLLPIADFYGTDERWNNITQP